MYIEVLSLLNLKCSGCSAKIQKALNELEDVSEIQFNKETRNLEYKYSQTNTPNTVLDTIRILGYPIGDRIDPATNKNQSIVCCPASIKAHEMIKN